MRILSWPAEKINLPEHVSPEGIGVVCDGLCFGPESSQANKTEAKSEGGSKKEAASSQKKESKAPAKKTEKKD